MTSLIISKAGRWSHWKRVGGANDSDCLMVRLNAVNADR